MEWWDGFYDIYTTYRAEKAQQSYVEDAWIADNVGYHIPSDVPRSSPNTAIPVHDIFHVDELRVDLRFVEMDHLRQGVPYVMDFSQPMEQIPSMPQQSEGKEKGEGDDINFERTMQMEPNSRSFKKIKFSVSEPSEAGCSIGFNSVMQQAP